MDTHNIKNINYAQPATTRINVCNSACMLEGVTQRSAARPTQPPEHSNRPRPKLGPVPLSPPDL
eukprot:498985-Alexandrium_andersonii.AAC.1